jgi:hypothetical protein
MLIFWLDIEPKFMLGIISSQKFVHKFILPVFQCKIWCSSDPVVYPNQQSFQDGFYYFHHKFS